MNGTSFESKQTGSNKMQTLPLEWASFCTLFRDPVILIVAAFRDFTLSFDCIRGLRQIVFQVFLTEFMLSQTIVGKFRKSADFLGLSLGFEFLRTSKKASIR